MLSTSIALSATCQYTAFHPVPFSVIGLAKKRAQMAPRKKTAKAQVPLRVLEPLRAQLSKAAKAHGVSMNAEITRRLERSLERDDWLGGQRVAALVEAIGTAMRVTGENAAFIATGRPREDGAWLDQPYAFDQAVKAAQAILEQFRPMGEIVIPEPKVVEVVGGDEEVSLANRQLKTILRDLGQLYAAKTMRDRAED
jgi:hypothetical protein